ncbi:MAG TPA: polysaccharide biosynthesis tyrosine autokinase [Candidatus Cybelea sp.]|jgi:capsular exopolysaccharide synthesis family protein|nr:polysaccharide biosynthesis tyrosine autokinase [Candidatus Cybelea sp.]
MIDRYTPSFVPVPTQVRDTVVLFDEWLAVAKRHKKLILITLGVLLTLVLLAALTTPRSYTSEASVIVGAARQPNSGDAPTNLPILNALMVVSGIQSGETYAELMTEAPVARQVIAQLGLGTSDRALLAHVKAEPVNNTSVIRITASWSTPQTSARIANAFATTFIDHERDLVAGQADSAIRFLSAEMPSAARRQRVADSALSAFQRRHQVADMNAQAQDTISALAALDVKSGQLQLDRKQASAELGSDVAQTGSMAPTTSGSQSLAPNPVVQQLNTQLAQLQTQLGDAERVYTDKHPTVVALKDQVRELQQEIAREPATVVSGTSTVVNPAYEQLREQATGYRTQIASDSAGLAEIAAQRKKLVNQIKLLPEETLQLAALQRTARQAEAVYEAMQQRMSDAMIAKNTAISDVTITETADPADAVVHPSRLAILLIGALVSLILTVTLIATLEYLDRRARSERDIRAAFGRQVLGTIPDLDAADPQSLPWLRAMALESLLKLARSIWMSTPRQLHSIAFTSPRAGDGKSTIAINVAWTVAEMNQRVLLIDADLRRPTLHKLLSLPNELGLSDVLSGTTSFTDAVRPTSIRNVDLLTSGTPFSSPAFLVQSGDLSGLLREARECGYDRVIVDLPAVMPVVDAAAVAEKLDGTVLVVSATTGGAEVAREAVAYVESLGIRNLLGLVVNRVRRDTGDDAEYYLGSHGSPLALP